jgi:hypothetical protein
VPRQGPQGLRIQSRGYQLSWPVQHDDCNTSDAIWMQFMVTFRLGLGLEAESTLTA